MDLFKESKNVEFDVIYDDGSRRRVKEGVLFEVEDERINFHNGTDRPEVIFAVFRAAHEVIRNMINAPKEVVDEIVNRLLMEWHDDQGGENRG